MRASGRTVSALPKIALTVEAFKKKSLEPAVVPVGRPPFLLLTLILNIPFVMKLLSWLSPLYARA